MRAHEAGLSYGKYMAYLELKELDPDIAPEDVQGMTMREIRDRIGQLSGNAELSDIDGSGQESGGHHQENYGGHGAGRGRHHGE